LSEWAVGWLLLGLAGLVFTAGFALRWYVGRAQETDRAASMAFAVRRSAVGRFIFGPSDDGPSGDSRPRTVLDGDELDQLFVMPTIVVGSGLCLVAVFLLFFDLVGG
jgi:hypothetical protein